MGREGGRGEHDALGLRRSRYIEARWFLVFWCIDLHAVLCVDFLFAEKGLIKHHAKFVPVCDFLISAVVSFCWDAIVDNFDSWQMILLFSGSIYAEIHHKKAFILESS